jgi:DNA-binding transcriptional ArsR family regulator
MANASQIGQTLTALSDATRREVFELVAERPRAVGELAAQLPVSRPAVSQHLRVLKDAGLVEDEAVGARRVYKLHPEGIAELRSYLDGFWSRSLRAFKAAAEAGEEEDR